MGGYEIRPIEADDIEQISTAHTAIWKATYVGMVAQEKLDALTPAESASRRVGLPLVGDAGRIRRPRCARGPGSVRDLRRHAGDGRFRNQRPGSRSHRSRID